MKDDRSDALLDRTKKMTASLPLNRARRLVGKVQKDEIDAIERQDTLCYQAEDVASWAWDAIPWDKELENESLDLRRASHFFVRDKEMGERKRRPAKPPASSG